VAYGRKRDRDNYGFERADFGSDSGAIVISGCGLEGSGKTDFALTGPEPIYYYGIDPNVKSVIKKWQKRKEIYINLFRAPAISFAKDRDDVKDVAQPEWDRFLDSYRAVAEEDVDPPAATVVLDTATEFRELQLLSEFGKAIQIPQQLYTPVNAVYQDLVKAMKACPSLKVLVLLHRVKDVYETKIVKTRSGKEEKSERVPGKYERQGYNKTGNLVECEVLLKHDIEQGDELADRFGLEWWKCTPRPILTGEEAFGVVGRRDPIRVASVKYIVREAYPDMDTDEWTWGTQVVED
jgi:hypothetical protein